MDMDKISCLEILTDSLRTNIKNIGSQCRRERVGYWGKNLKTMRETLEILERFFGEAKATLYKIESL